MQIGLFFGSFNPIHLGHTGLAQYLLEHTCLEQIWLVVSPNNPLKEPGSLLDEHVRYRLACMATADLPGISATDFEFSLPKPNYTITTLEAFSQAYPEHRFSLIMGSDNMAIFHRWRSHQIIQEHYPIIVYPREGDDMKALMEQYPTMQVVEGAPLFEVSATQIREKLTHGIDSGSWLHPDVEDFLKKNTLLFANIK